MDHKTYRRAQKQNNALLIAAGVGAIIFAVVIVVTFQQVIATL